MNNFPISILDSKELYTSSTRILTILIDTLSADNFAVAMCAKLKKGTSDMEQALGKSLTSDFTPLILDKDKARDNGFLSLREYVKSGIHDIDPAIASASKKISTIIQTIGNDIYKHGNIVETAEMNTLIAELSKPEVSALLKIIGADAKFKVMSDAQVYFEETYKSKVTIDSAINYPLLKDSKTRVTKSLYALLSYVESNAELDAAQFGPIEKKINTVITDVVAIARTRITKAENEKKKGGTDGTLKS